MRAMAHVDAVTDLIEFLGRATTPWHAVRETAARLRSAGFVELDEGTEWTLAAGQKAFVIRGGSSIAAFELGTAPIEEAGFRWVGAHTDSPNLRVKPQPSLKRHGHHQAGVEVYGGVLLHTWLDRDLSLAGRLVLRDGANVREALVDLRRAVARVPALAIHLDRSVNSEGLVLNAQTQLPPVLGLESGGSLDLKEILATELERGGERANAADILAFDLCFYDSLAPAIGGIRGEYLHAARLDNLASCHAALSALLAASPEPRATRGFVLYDHEECGSVSAQGADSSFLRMLMERVLYASSSKASSTSVARALHHSFFVSADMAHAIHPNYADRHEPQHAPQLGQGPVIKINNNQRYATDALSHGRFLLACEAAEVVPQRFVTRSDLPCGSTIGPMSSANLGIRTIDIGNPMWSMHSCRETAAVADVPKMIAVLTHYFQGVG